MDVTLKKSVRNGLRGFLVGTILSLISGIYDLISGVYDFSFINLLWTLGGVLLIGIYFFTPVFIVSLIVYYFKDKNG